jgi:hypothetical protein
MIEKSLELRLRLRFAGLPGLAQVSGPIGFGGFEHPAFKKPAKSFTRDATSSIWLRTQGDRVSKSGWSGGEAQISFSIW